MSLYKGNNLISGHQVLYSTTGNNTDGAMTQDATTDELNGKVSKSGDTMTGALNIDTTDAATNIDFGTNLTIGTAPATNTYRRVKMTDSSDNELACIQLENTVSNGISQTGSVLIARNKKSDNTGITAYFGIYSGANGTNNVLADAQTKAGLANLSFPSYSYASLTKGSSGTQYTAPADGFVFWRDKASAISQYIAIMRLLKTNGTTDRWIESSVMWSHTANTDLYAWAMFRKGDTFRLNYNAAGSSSLTYLLFVYAQAEAIN